MDAAKVKVTLVKSQIGILPKHKRTVKALGLRKINSSNIMPDNAATRGMVEQVKYLVKVSPVSE
jgi:large subunit ribosomal protein L30